MPALLVLLLLVVPLVEIYLLVQVGQVIGALPTIALLVVMSVLGAWLLRREGARTWTAFRSALSAGRVPAREVADGALVVLGGALLLTPGFATDVVGLAFVLPVSRSFFRRLLTGVVARRLGVPGVVGGMAAEHLRTRRRTRPGEVVEGEVVEQRNADGPPPAGDGPSYG